jgi:hypothetical protein
MFIEVLIKRQFHCLIDHIVLVCVCVCVCVCDDNILDVSPYVRKTAAAGCAKVFHFSPESIRGSHLFLLCEITLHICISFYLIFKFNF